jgi:hypothetical protein
MTADLVTIAATKKQYCLFILNRVDKPTEFIPILEDDDPEVLVRALTTSGRVKLEKGQWWHIVDKYTFAIVREGSIK